jgi:HD-GYP domain-containing protein (c-di-GMP phosphodiesterase class II)
MVQEDDRYQLVNEPVGVHRAAGEAGMTDTRVLLSRIAALRQRMELAHGKREPRPADSPDPVERLEGQVAAGHRHSALLDGSFRQLHEADDSPEAPGLPIQLTARARRLLLTGQGLLSQLRSLAEAFPSETKPDPCPPLGHWLGIDPAEPLGGRYRETVAMLDTALRTVQAYPDSPGAQLRLCDGLEASLNVVTERSATLKGASDERRTRALRLENLADMLVRLAGGRPVETTEFIALGEALLADVEHGAPLRFYTIEPLDDPKAGYAATWHARAVASHCLTVAGVVARLVRHEPDLRGQPVEPVVAALVHDVGMLRLPTAVYAHPGPLDEEQRRALEGHTRAGAELVSKAWPAAGWLADACVSHHERHDGTGYPAGLRQMQIAPLVRFLAVCDVYAALCTPRPHRAAREPRTALTDTLLIADKGALDRNFAERLLHLSFYPVGSVVELADGAIALVAAPSQGQHDVTVPARPVVALLTDTQGAWLPTPQYVNLADCADRTIVRALNLAERRRVLGKRYPELAS